ncbi:MAG: 2-oxoacid:acceptor oxidoreductase family protein [candidate division WOR-3 bacterium]
MKVKGLYEIRWHGRGGMGTVTAALLVADALVRRGKFVQAIPEFGPERRGAPVRAFNRISDKSIRLRSGITEPDMVVVIDSGFIDSPDVLEGLAPNGIILVNSVLPADDLRKKIKVNGRRLFSVDASGIALASFGRNIPNTPIVGAVSRVLGDLLPIDALEEALVARFRLKGEKVVNENLTALRKAYEEVKEI